MTRSRTKVTPNQYTQIPFVLKAFKLLLKDVQAVGPGAGEGKGKGKAGDVELDDDDGVSFIHPLRRKIRVRGPRRVWLGWG